MKKILVITPFFYPHIGGSEQYIEELYTQVINTHRDISVDVLCYDTNKAFSYEKYRGLTIYRIPCWNILPDQFSLPHPFPLLQFLYKKRGTYDLIHCSTRFFDSSWWGPLYARLIQRKILLTDHCADTPRHENRFINLLVSCIDSVSGKLFIRRYHKIFTVSKTTSLFLKHKFHASSSVMYGGVNLKIFQSNKNRKENKRIKVIYAGRLIPAKGVYNLFYVAQQMDNIDFIFVGPGKLGGYFKNEIAKNKHKHIVVMDAVNKVKLAKLLKTSDIFVLPSYHSEGIPMTLLEAGLSKLAVVATDVGGIKEVIENNETGLLIKPRSHQVLQKAIQSLVESKRLRDKLSNNLSKYVQENFSWEKTSEKMYLEILRLTNK